MLIDALVTFANKPYASDWPDEASKCFEDLWAGEKPRYPVKTGKAVAIRAPKGLENGVPFAALIHPNSAASGAYGGMSFVLFPVKDAPSLIALVVGTQGLSPDEEILGRPGHARKAQAICRWLSNRSRDKPALAWSKADPTRVDQTVPNTVTMSLDRYSSVFDRYGKVIYAFFQINDDKALTRAALVALLDMVFDERGIAPLASSKGEFEELRGEWMSHLLPSVSEGDVVSVLQNRRHVILAGPPGTGKTRMALSLLRGHFGGNGLTVQFHPNTTYENLVGGLAPQLTSSALGLSFVPRAGYLLRATEMAAKDTSRPYVLHIDEINRADLSKILGEAIFALEPDDDVARSVELAYDFAEIGGRTLSLPANLHLLGTMNTADKSIAPIDLAVRRRFAFVNMWPQFSVIKETACPIMIDAFERLQTIFVEHASDEAFDLMPGHSYFLERDEAVAAERLRTTVGALLREYLSQGYVAGFAPDIRAYLQWLESM